MVVKTTDFTKSRQRLENPPPAENRMNPDRRPHRVLWVLGILLLVATAVGARSERGPLGGADPRRTLPPHRSPQRTG